jgi:ABC-type multidrug transport system fused ATPase/permease subunit
MDRRERRLTALVFIMAVVVALFEAVGVASVMPFMAVLANPDVIERNQYLAAAYDRLGFTSADDFLFFLGIAFLILIVGSLIFRGFAFWVQTRFSLIRNYEWSTRLVARYLDQPYEWFLGQHSGSLGSSVLNEVGRMVDGVLTSAINVISQFLVVTLLLALMVAVDPLLAMSVGAAVGLSYLALFLTVRPSLAALGDLIVAENRSRYKVAQEAFGGIKDVKVFGMEESFIARFRSASLRYAESHIKGKLIAEIPSFAMQAIVFGGVVAVLLYFMGRQGGLETALPVFSLYALAGYRLMPAGQAIYRHLSEMRITAPILDDLFLDLVPLHARTPNEQNNAATGQERPMGLHNYLELRDIYLKYSGSGRWALEGIDLKIPALSKVGLVGPTGSGKTTLIDVVLGLLQPEHGELVVDGNRIHAGNRRSWQRSIGYVPQQIFLSDDTIGANIAFGVEPHRVDHGAVERAARIANLHDFVTGDLPGGYTTRIGERGVRLSGGQRQRIGIARALYHDPDILILDEATSALDNITEHVVMDAVRNLAARKTIILIAHRLSTVRDCDRIFYLDRGRLISAGTYDELLASNEAFRKMDQSASSV